MKKNWFDSKVKEFSSIGGYQKPQLNENSLKLDSNENYVLSKQFQNDIVSGARKNSDVREYPLGGVERLIQMISKFVKVPSSMIGIGNGSDQILDLILSNFASKQTKVLTSNPTFGFFEERCKLYSIPLIAIPFAIISPITRPLIPIVIILSECIEPSNSPSICKEADKKISPVILVP